MISQDFVINFKLNISLILFDYNYLSNSTMNSINCLFINIHSIIKKKFCRGLYSMNYLLIIKCILIKINDFNKKIYYFILIIYEFMNLSIFKLFFFGDWGLGIGDWGLGKIGRAHV